MIDNLQVAIGDLASLREGWTLLAETDPAEFMRQVKAEIERLQHATDFLDQALNEGDGVYRP